MMAQDEIARLTVKTPQQRFQCLLEQEFGVAPRIAQDLAEQAEACFAGRSGRLQAGQVRVILARREARTGQVLCETETTEVVWTVDAGQKDRVVWQEGGRRVLRQHRIRRLLKEALDQGAVATQEDVAQVLHVSPRTIKRDFAELEAAGVYLPSRGHVHSVGRGQTHKAQIIARWLRGETYDQLTLHTHHSATSIQHYIQTFVRVVQLHEQGCSESDIALLLQLSTFLVQEYLAVYRQHDEPSCRERLQAHLQRLGHAAEASQGEKKGAS